MTCIIGCTDGTNVYMAGDECASTGDYSTVIGFSKVFKKCTPCGTEVLIGLRGRLFTVQDDFSVVQHAEPYDAVGCGCWEALAVMYALQYFQIPGQEALPKALAAAAKFNSGVMCGDVVRVFKA